MPITLDPGLVGTNPVHALVVALVLFAVTVPLALTFAAREQQPWLAGVVLVSFGAHLVGSALQVLIVARVYDNVADFHLYDGQGAALREAWLAGSFPTAGLEIPGTGSVSIATGLVYSVVGVDQLGGFFVFSWLGLLGLMAAYRAFRLCLPDAEHRRYAWLLFLMPSLLYWPTVAGKEAVMLLALSLMLLGAAHVFTHSLIRGSGYLAAGSVIGGLVRPHEVALLFGAFCVGILVRRSPRPSVTTPLRWTLTFLVVAGVGIVMLRFTMGFLGITDYSPAAIAAAVNDAHVATQGEGEGFGSSHTTWNPSPLYYPQDVYLVLFKPLPFESTEMTQLISSAENTVLIILLMYFWRSLTAVRKRLRSPYVAMCLVYSLLFLYIFAALGNVGLLVRERTLLFPMLFVLLTLPRVTAAATAPARERAERPPTTRADGVGNGSAEVSRAGAQSAVPR